MLKTYQKCRLSRNLRSLVHFYSSQPVVKEKNADDHQLKDFERISNIQQKIKIKKPQKPPFVKNLLLGVFDTDLLTYPEITNEELADLNKGIEKVQTFLQQPEINECSEVSRPVLKKLANQQLLGLQTSQLMGGRELNATETCRFVESLSEINLRHVLINNEVLGVQILSKFGNDQLKRKYLQKLIDGESLSAFCVLEPLDGNFDEAERTGSTTPDGKFWVLNGQKKLVINGSSADLYFVVANTSNVVKDEIKEGKYTVFLVERDFGGVTSEKKRALDDTVELSNLVFENCQVPADNVIGAEEMGETILLSIYPQYRLSTGPVCSVLVRNVIDRATNYFINNSKAPDLLYDTDAVRCKLGEMLTSLYAIDSMTYLTSGLIDNYENQDTELETTIVKVFASEQAFLNTSACLDLIGPEASLENHWCNQLHKEALCQVTLNDSNDNLKILIALFGLRYAGQKLNDLIKKIRNPFYYSSFVLKRMWRNRKHGEDNPKLNLYLHHYLHPSSMQASQRLEYCVLRLQFATETLLARHAAEVVNKHADLRRLADSTIDIFAMIATISRASRSYCIGLQHAEYEMTLAAAFAMSATERVRANLNKIIEGQYTTNDENYRFLSQRLFDFKKYYPVHPLTRNF